jgi:transposase
MPSGYPLTIEQRKEIITLYVTGVKASDIAKQKKCSHQTVLNIVKNNNALTEAPQKRGRKLSAGCEPLEEEKVRAFYAENPDVYLDEAYNILKTKRSTLYGFIQKIGLTRKKSKPFMPKVALKNN